MKEDAVALLVKLDAMSFLTNGPSHWNLILRESPPYTRCFMRWSKYGGLLGRLFICGAV